MLAVRRARSLTPVVATIALLSACGSDGGASADVAVNSGDDTCELSTTSVPAGTVTFSVENTGSRTTEFYVYEGDGTTIVGEVENVGPSLTRDLTVTLEAGSYITACKPGMTGDGIRAPFDAT
jgi:iron uptake system component EfeO